ncbi:ATP-binding protein [Methylocystis sp. ATCC 49242]|uniref:ATP-binding protein n=1 Tax=Methylocystis sp. ATCC 49242 TaxID=622637 RepID=UPI0001F8710F|nr:ATP-binding protein [Methylocystis sp. ATCC 49242]
MKIIHKDFTSVSNGALATTEFCINFDATMAYALMSGIAKDKIRYPVREVGTNAYDANPSQPFHVQLPTMFDPTFKVRDNGSGLSHHAMMTLYTTFGGSGKRHTNDQVGGLGYGCKSPIAYLISKGQGGASFTVQSFQNGEVHTYVMALSPEGMPECHYFGSTPTNEPSGLEVSFTVDKEDIAEFTNAAKEIYWHFPVRPNITPSSVIEWTGSELEKGSNWTLYNSNTSFNNPPFKYPHVRMGCVAYPINFETIGQRNWPWSHANIVFDAPIGSLSFTTSREELGYDEPTKKQINELLRSFEVDYAAKLQSKIDSAKTYVEACSIVESLYQTHQGVGHLLSNNLLNFKGKNLRTSFSTRLLECRVMVVDDLSNIDKFEADGVHDRRASSWSISACNMSRIKSVVYNTKSSLMLLTLLKLKHLNPETPFLWVRPKNMSINEALLNLGLDDLPCQNIDEVKLPKRVVKPAQKRDPNVKPVYFINSNGRADAKLPCDLSQGGVFVVLHHRPHHRREKFFLRSPFKNVVGGYEVRNITNFLTDRKLIDQKHIWCFLPDEVPQTDDWVLLGDYIDAQLTPLIDDKELIRFQDRKGLEGELQRWSKCLPHLDTTVVPQDLLDFCKQVDEAFNLKFVDDGLYTAYIQYCSQSRTERKTLNTILKDQRMALEIKYPLLHLLSSYISYYWEVKPKGVAEINHYFTLLANHTQKEAA